MVALQAGLQVVAKAMPVLAKQLPKLWPLLLDGKNREKVLGLVRDLAVSSPHKRLASKLELTEMLAQRIAEQAADNDEREQAADWERRARRLRARLDMPIGGASARRAHRKSLREDMTALHDEMSDALRE